MARIPIVTSSIDARSGRSSATVGGRSASPAAFGGALADGMKSLGAGLGQAADLAFDLVEKRRNETVANTLAQNDFTRTELEIRNRVGPDGAGYQATTLETYDKWVDSQLEGIDDPVARQKLKEVYQRDRADVSSRAAVFAILQEGGNMFDFLHSAVNGGAKVGHSAA